MDLTFPSPADYDTTAYDTKDDHMNASLFLRADDLHREGVPDPRVSPLAPDSPSERFDESSAPRRPVARCADGSGTMSGLFFSDHVADIARAKAMCDLCPLKFECLAGALEREEPWGVWGGELLSGGRIVANKRPCGRPPKNPRPEVVYDEMGPVGLDLTA